MKRFLNQIDEEEEQKTTVSTEQSSMYKKQKLTYTDDMDYDTRFNNEQASNKKANRQPTLRKPQEVMYRTHDECRATTELQQ